MCPSVIDYVTHFKCHPPNVHLSIPTPTPPPQVLCQKILEAVSVASGGAKRAIIILLPEILEDAQHHDAATELK